MKLVPDTQRGQTDAGTALCNDLSHRAISLNTALLNGLARPKAVSCY